MRYLCNGITFFYAFSVEIKKSYRADLEHRRPWFFLIGLVLSAVLLAAALLVPIEPEDEEVDAEMLERLVQDMEFKPQRPDENLVAYEKPARKQPEPRTKINVVERNETSAPQEQTEQQSLTEGESKDVPPTEAEHPTEAVPFNEDDNPLNFRVVERLPEFPGGAVEFMKWLTRNLRYPQAARNQKIQGRVLVSFIVNKDGTTSDFKVLKSAHPMLDREAMRVVRMMPNWKPGEDHGKPCRTMFAIPVVFAL